jgi:hypothetical protein
MPDDTRPSGSEADRPIADARARPLVSVVIPSYNCERYIHQTLQSIVTQTVTDWEVIVVDDGSTDATVAIASNIDPRVRVVQQANAGVCVARNRGYAESSGRYLCFMDHDDYWFAEKLERQLGWMQRMPELGVVYSTCIRWHAVAGVFPPPESLRPASDEDTLDAEFTGWVYHQFMRDSCALTSSALIRRGSVPADLAALSLCPDELAQHALPAAPEPGQPGGPASRFPQRPPAARRKRLGPGRAGRQGHRPQRVPAADRAIPDGIWTPAPGQW